MNHIGPASTHALSVSQQLRRAREEIGIDIVELVRRTRMSHYLIEAVERGEWQRFRGQIYAVGGVRAYATALGDGPSDALLAELDVELARIWPPEEEEAMARLQPRKPLWGRAGAISLMQ